MNNTIPATSGVSDKIASGLLTGLKKIPYIKNKVSTPRGEKIAKKVISIAIEVFKGLGIIAAGAMMGALIGAGFGGPIPLVISTVVGGLGAGIAYFAAKCVVAVIVKYAYPSNRYLKENAISSDHWRDDKNHKAFDDTLKTFKDEEWFKSWLALKGYDKCNNFLWRRFKKGFCYGETHALLQIIQKNSDAEASTLIGKVDAETVFKKQILETIRADFAAILEKDQSAQIKGMDRDELKDHLAVLTKTTVKVEGMRRRSSCHFNKKMLVGFADFKRHFEEYTEQLSDRHPTKQFAGTIRIESKKKAHTLFVQYKDGHYRFYDGYNTRRTGFYEFPDKKAFLRGLHRHLRAYAKVPNLTLTTYNKATLQLYSF